MSGVFQNIDPPPPHRPACVYCVPRLWCGGRTRSLGGDGGWGVNILEDVRHCSEHYTVYVYKNFVGYTFPAWQTLGNLLIALFRSWYAQNLNSQSLQDWQLPTPALPSEENCSPVYNYSTVLLHNVGLCNGWITKQCLHWSSITQQNLLP